jgi:hypothetical protein
MAGRTFQLYSSVVGMGYLLPVYLDTLMRLRPFRYANTILRRRQIEMPDDQNSFDNEDASANTQRAEAEALTKILSALEPFDSSTRTRLIDSIRTFYGMDKTRATHSVVFEPVQSTAGTHGSEPMQFSKRASLSPKDFLHQKQPHTDVERVACLAYYLTHYRDQPQFKTVDLSALNTEAAQIKLSNPSYALQNAYNTGLLTNASKGFKQLSAIGERYVDALPDRDAAREAVRAGRRKRRVRKPIPPKP